MRDAGLAVYTFPEDAARALAAMVRYRQWLERPAGVRATFADVDRAGIATLVAAVRADRRTQLTLVEAQRCSRAPACRCCPGARPALRTRREAAATALGFPVVAKLSSSVIVHKSEVGGVRLGIASADAVARRSTR